MRGLPTSIFVDGKEYKITNNADYRVILDVFDCLNDTELEGGERFFAAALVFFEDLTVDNVGRIFKDQEQYARAITEMVNFCDCYEKSAPQRNYKLYDWNDDEQIIFSAINKAAGFEIRDRTKYIHWFTFKGYFNSVGEGTFSTVVSLREKIVKGEKREKWETKFINENPQYFSWDRSTPQNQATENKIIKNFYKK